MTVTNKYRTIKCKTMKTAFRNLVKLAPELKLDIEELNENYLLEMEKFDQTLSQCNDNEYKTISETVHYTPNAESETFATPYEYHEYWEAKHENGKSQGCRCRWRDSLQYLVKRSNECPE